MNRKAKNILRKYKGKKVGIFIDDANMFHAQKEARWWIDWRKFKNFLEANFKVKFIKYYRGTYGRREKIDKEIRKKHNRFSGIIRKIGFELIKRPLKKIYTNRKQGKYKYKCDFDAEIGFDVATNLGKIDLIILVSGDSDFVCLNSKVSEKGKNFLIICFEYKAPWEVRKIHHLFLEEFKEKIVLAKEKPRPRSG